ncbi:MAG: Omp28-related outer membrane protein [Flavobacteriales bacterium]|nr:Omp28-related outer membrane protein [Flavobacteriales bacterium]MBK7298240.1 Omp28-related outer membrane protein [Flavobacteriales bacterium]MBK9534135.1 Omp28-related outer membrane protein [Flavobacteriales bacterium]HQV53543.1 Omp28-related outer membrane protein [Flavobacteriales bacterium]HQW40720.1 Omp28-related outer membrane protein [Flavobacteriales bacterium]
MRGSIFDLLSCDPKPDLMKYTTLTKALLGLIIFTGAASLQAQNAYLENLALPRYIKAGVNYPVNVWARNASAVPMTSCTVKWQLDGGPIYTGSTGIGGGGVTTNNYLNYTHPNQLNTTQGTHTLVVWIETTVDTDPTNNTLTTEFTALTNYADKVVLLEGRTETWCQYCPTANTVTNTLMNNPDFAVAKFHLSDAFDTDDGIAYYGQYNVSFTPAGVLDMGEYGSYTPNSGSSGWEAAMTARAAGVAPTMLSLSPSMNWTTRTLTVTMTANFTYSFAGPFNLNVYLLEDNCPGSQTNGGAGSNYIHNAVVRAMLGGSTGTSGVVPNTPVVGTNYTHTYTYQVPANFKLADLKLIGVLEHKLGVNNRYCVNAVKSGVSAVGIDELTLAADRFQVFPNPFTNELRVSVADMNGPVAVELYTLDGRSVYQSTMVLDPTGNATLDLNSAKLAQGAYLLQINTSEGKATERVLKVD